MPGGKDNAAMGGPYGRKSLLPPLLRYTINGNPKKASPEEINNIVWKLIHNNGNKGQSKVPRSTFFCQASDIKKALENVTGGTVIVTSESNSGLLDHEIDQSSTCMDSHTAPLS